MSIDEFITSNEAPIRLSFFFGVFVVIALWELLSPKRALTVSKAVRWLNNLGIVVLNTVILRLIFPAAAVGVAAFASSQGWGLLNHFAVPYIVAVILSIIAINLIIYLQHIIIHTVPTL